MQLLERFNAKRRDTKTVFPKRLIVRLGEIGERIGGFAGFQQAASVTIGVDIILGIGSDEFVLVIVQFRRAIGSCQIYAKIVGEITIAGEVVAQVLLGKVNSAIKQRCLG